MVNFFKEYKYAFLISLLLMIAAYFYFNHLKGCNKFEPYTRQKYFTQHCKCLGQFKSSQTDQQFSYISEKKCVGLIVYHYYTFETRLPYVDDIIGEPVVKNKKHAYELCEQAAPLLATLHSTENVQEEAIEALLNNCKIGADSIFRFNLPIK